MEKGKIKSKGRRISKGKITSKEMVQVRMARPLSKELKPSAPIEAMKGIGVKRGKALRKKGISTVGEYKEHIQKQIDYVEASERAERSGFFNEMKQDQYDDVINSRYRQIHSIKNPHEKIRLLKKLKKDADVKVIERKTDLVVTSKYVEKRLNSDIAKAEADISSGKIKYKWVVLNQEGNPYYRGDDKDKAVKIFKKVKASGTTSRVELHRYSKDFQLKGIQTKITKKSAVASRKEVKDMMNLFAPQIHEYIDKHRDNWQRILKAKQNISYSTGGIKKGISKSELRRVLEQDAGIDAYEIEDIKGSENWINFAEKKFKESMVFEDKQLKLNSTLNDRQKFYNTTALLSDMYVSAKELKKKEADDLQTMKNQFTHANIEIKTAKTDGKVDNLVSKWKKEDKEVRERLEDYTQRQYQLGRQMKNYADTWYGMDVQERFETLIMPVLNDVAISNTRLFTFNDVVPKKVEFQASVRKQTLEREERAKKVKEVAKQVKEGDTTNVLAFRGETQQWVKLPHGQVVRLLNNRFAFKQSTKGFDKAITSAKVLKLYEKGKLSPEEAYIMAFILSKDAGYDSLDEWRKDNQNQSGVMKDGIMDKSRFTGLFRTEETKDMLKSGDYASYDLKSSTFGQMIHRNTKSDNQQTTGTVQEREEVHDRGVTLTYEYNDKQDRKVILDRKSVDKFFNIFRKTRNSDTYPFKAIHFASQKPVIIDFAKANLSVMVAPIQPETDEDEDFYEDDDEDLLDDLD